MKFLHAADIHLDSPLTGLSRRGGVPERLLAEAMRRPLANLVDLAIAEDVAFVVIAGDLYDAHWKDYGTGLYFAAEMRRLNRPCFVVLGNHDARSVVTQRLVLPETVTVFPSNACLTETRPALGVALHGRSFENRKEPANFAQSYLPPVQGLLNIGVLHTSAEGDSAHDTYAPCSVEMLELKGYDYWALGHIHDRRILSRRVPIVFPGNVQGRHARETGSKGCTLVEVQDGRVIDLEHRPLDILRWAAPEVDLSGADRPEELAARVRAVLEDARTAAEGRPLVVRLHLTGATPLHGALLADPAQTDGECRNAAAAAGDDVFIESVRVRTALPRGARAATPNDSLSPLRQAFFAALDDGEATQDLLNAAAQLSGRLPSRPDLFGAPVLPAAPGDLRDLAEEAWLLVEHALDADRSA